MGGGRVKFFVVGPLVEELFLRRPLQYIEKERGRQTRREKVLNLSYIWIWQKLSKTHLQTSAPKLRFIFRRKYKKCTDIIALNMKMKENILYLYN